MGMFANLFGHDNNRGAPELLSAIERAVSTVEPLLKQMRGYPGYYREPVAAALAYAQGLASRVPGPVMVDRESYAKDAFVHVLFPDADFVEEAICSSSAMQDYFRNFPAADELYALMGMRRFEKSMVGMELSGQTIQHDVVQRVVYFTSHTLENAAPSEQQARSLVAASFLDSLVGKVKERVAERKRSKQSKQLEKDLLMARIHAAPAQERPLLKNELARLMDSIQSSTSSLELSHYAEDFEAVLLDPGQYLRLEQRPLILDSMGIRRERDGASGGEALMFYELIGYDRRDWTVTMVRCRNLHRESFATKLEKAYRRLVI
jgi:hypothetical protein